MVHPTNHIWRVSNLRCDSSVSLLNLYGMTVFICFLSCMVHPTKSIASVGLAQAWPSYELLHTYNALLLIMGFILGNKPVSTVMVY